ncbi:hypothetical protein [Chryseobacterium populi]|uniref:Uncharacterized protein n=1 Tax=Chryseobacterium populi TaxID=1144316 RepID=J2K6G5_9FLAO|nr:hypothetical protein [Chryseobacterium populi]EJL75810.1 hypothetical protein PMI13_00205 [Chryseobacterium populi]
MNFIQSMCFVLCLFAVESASGQETKTDKRTKEALAQRYAADKLYTDYQRGIYNREAWKASWVGAKLSELYKSWGVPTRTATDEKGGKVLVYENVTNTAGGSYTPGYIETATNGFGQTVVTGQKAAEDTRWSSQYITITTVYADKNGVITKVDFDSKYSRN